METTKLRVSIVGGGIGGLSTAVALRRHGIEATVFEQARTLGEVGAGVVLMPNALKLLDRLGLKDAMNRIGAAFSEESGYHLKDGTYVAPRIRHDSKQEYSLLGMHRADLLTALADALPADSVRTGHRCVGFEQNATSATLTFDNGNVVESDIVLAADGIRSTLQQYVVEPSEPIHSGMVAYRGLVAAADLPEGWPLLANRVWMGEGSHFLTFPVRNGEMVNYVGFLPSSEHAQESWSAPGDPKKLAAAFATWDPQITGLLGSVESTFWWGLYDRTPLEKWVNGRLALVGDAAHPMLPHVGQGANQAIEDAYTLGVLLERVSPENVAEALLAYEQVRLPRASQIQSKARENGRRYDGEYDDLRERDAEIVASSASRLETYDYDAGVAALAAAEALN